MLLYIYIYISFIRYLLPLSNINQLFLSDGPWSKSIFLSCVLLPLPFVFYISHLFIISHAVIIFIIFNFLLTSDVFIILNFFLQFIQIILISIHGIWKITFLKLLCYNFKCFLTASFLIWWQNRAAQGSFIFLTGVKVGSYGRNHADYKDRVIYYIEDL